jgi:hypothetical protein
MTPLRVRIVATTALGVLVSVILSHGQSLPSSSLPSVTKAIERDFGLVDEIRTISMSDEPSGRFDFIVIGAKRSKDPEWAGWRVEVLSVIHGRVIKKWDSAVSATEVDFERSGIENIDVRPKEHDYDVLIEGCAHHQCGDGIDGFLLFSGKSGKEYKAKVVARDMGSSQRPNYDVTFSNDISDEAKRILQDEICSSTVISNKLGLPFPCKAS